MFPSDVQGPPAKRFPGQRLGNVVLAELSCGSQVVSFKKLFLRNQIELAANRTSAQCEGSRSVLTSAREFAQDELLSQTADDMQTQVYPKSLEYMPGSTI